MKKSRKNFSVIFFIISFVVLISFFYLATNKVFAAELEVEYPILRTGATVTSQSDLSEYLKYIFDLGMFVGFFAVFLSLIWAGVLYLLSPAIPNAMAEAKDRISGAISGLLILVLLYLIITTINPYLAFFTLTPLEKIPPPPPAPAPAGVSFYISQNCSGDANTNITSVPDLGTNLKNNIKSVGIIHSSEQKIYYISILYDNPNYWGKCQYINPNTSCSTVEPPFADSASIHSFDFNPSGNGVFFYRKSFNNKDGGFLKITNSEIKNEGSGKLYVADLRELKFTGESSSCTVPIEEQDCVKWDNKNKCVEKQCPNLANENISSIEIDGNYLVLFVYFNPPIDNKFGPWTYCQAFPGKDDVNKEGPQQIKWEHIRSDPGAIPNYVLIIPVKEK